MFTRPSAAGTQKHPACIHPQGISNQQILWNIIVLNMEAHGNGNLQEHSPVPYSDARLVLIMLWECEIAKVAQLYILPCLSFVLPPLFYFFTSTPSHRLCSLTLFSAERQESHAKLWTWKEKLKNNNKDNRSLHVSRSVCVFLLTWRHFFFTHWGIFPSNVGLCAYLRCYFGCVWVCLRGSRLSCLGFDFTVAALSRCM